MEKDQIKDYTFMKSNPKENTDLKPSSFSLSGLKNAMLTPELILRLESLIKSNFISPVDKICNELSNEKRKTTQLTSTIQKLE